MNARLRSQLPSIVFLVAAFGMILIALLLLQRTPVAQAQAAGVCRTAIVLDRSGSVGFTNLETMRQQILRLFQPTGLYSDNIQLAFWSFSSGLGVDNYNAPYHGFVTSRGVSSSFQTSLNQMVSSGMTNYEQGFGYHRGNMNSNQGVRSIINQANIIVFMTDGLPNTPSGPNGGTGNDGNPYAREVARDAVLKHKAAGKAILGGMVGTPSSSSLNFVLNGSTSNGTDTFRISTNYQDLAVKLREVIGEACDDFNPPQAPYALTPAVTSNNNIITGSDGATFSYNVTNATSNGNVTPPSTWTVRQVVVDRGQSADALRFNGATHRDGYSCPQLVSLVNGRATCSEIARGQRAFPSGVTSLDSTPGMPTRVVVNDNWGVGTKVCNVLTIDKPTNNDQPVQRFSRAVCLIVGKRPFVQVHGGDLRVGRHFINDSGTDTIPANIGTSLTIKADGRTYGSWAEYGVFASGTVVGFASQAGLQGGYESTLPNTQEFWSDLTFANANNEFGRFTPADMGQGTIPDAKSAWLNGRNQARNLAGVETINLSGNQANGVYRKETGNLTINASLIERNKTYVVHVPNGTVTINGNLDYFDGPYTDASQIPQLVIIARNVVIRGAVTHVSAWIISDDPSGGTVTTCDSTATLTSQICNQPLTIDGPVMARHLVLKRTAGAGAAGAAGDAAETFNLTADSYLWALTQGRSDIRAQTTMTTELPPYF